MSCDARDCWNAECVSAPSSIASRLGCLSLFIKILSQYTSGVGISPAVVPVVN